MIILEWLILGVIMTNLATFAVLYKRIKDESEELDFKLASVIQQALKRTEEVAQMGENAPTPAQMMLMQMIQSKMQQNRGPDGQFISEVSS